MYLNKISFAHSSGRIAVYDVFFGQFEHRDYDFESRSRHGCYVRLSFVDSDFAQGRSLF
jgi:hypothetical protein